MVPTRKKPECCLATCTQSSDVQTRLVGCLTSHHRRRAAAKQRTETAQWSLQPLPATSLAVSPAIACLAMVGLHAPSCEIQAMSIWQRTILLQPHCKPGSTHVMWASGSTCKAARSLRRAPHCMAFASHTHVLGCCSPHTAMSSLAEVQLREPRPLDAVRRTAAQHACSCKVRNASAPRTFPLDDAAIAQGSAACCTPSRMRNDNWLVLCKTGSDDERRCFLLSLQQCAA